MSSQQAGSGDPQRSWRPGPSKKAKHSARKIQLAAGVILLAAIVGGIGYLLWAPASGGIPPLTYIGVGRTDYGASDLPPNPGAREDVLALDELFRQIAANDSGQKVQWAGDTRESLVKSKLPGVLQKALESPGNLFVFCSLHSEVVAETDEHGEHAELQLLLDGGTGVESRITLHQLIAALDAQATPGKKVILALDATTAPTWTRGILSAELEDLVKSDMAHLPAGMTVVLATSGLEHSWSLPPASEPVAGWKNRPGTVFGDAFYRAFSDETAAAGSDGILQLDELLNFVKNTSAEWNQTVTWHTSASSAAPTLSLMAVNKVPPPDEATADADPASEAKSGKTAVAGKASAGDSEKKSKATFEQRLGKLWQDRDQLVGVTSLPPDTWRQLNADLLRIEQTVLYGLHDWQSETQTGTRTRLEKALTDSEQRIAELRGGQSSTSAPPSLADWHSTPAAPTKETTKLLEDILAFAKTGENAAPAGALKEPAARIALAQELLRLVRDSDTPLDDYGRVWTDKVGPALKILADSKSASLYWRTSQWPAELVFLSAILRDMESESLRTPTSPWEDPESLQVLRNLLNAQAESNRLGSLLTERLLRPEIQTAVQPNIKEHQAAMLAAEQWMFAKDFSRCSAWTRQAKNELETAAQRAELTRQLLDLRDTLNLRLEDHARWIANRQEYRGLDLVEMPAAQKLRNLFPRLEEVESGIADTQQDNRSLVKDTTAQLTKLNEELGTVAATLATSPSGWTQIPELLQYPWLTSDQRKVLRKAFTNRKTAGEVRKTHGWQAFWCAKTLNPEKVDLQTFTKPNDGLAVAAFGAQVRDEWAAIQADADTDAEANMAASRNKLLTEWRTQIARIWVRRNRRRPGSGERDTRFTKPFQLPGSGIPKADLDAEQPPAALQVSLGDSGNWQKLPRVIRTDKNLRKQLRVRWEQDGNNNPRRLVLKSGNAKWSDQPSPVREVQNGQLLTIELLEKRNCDVVLALADVRDRALVFRRFVLGPEFDSSGWHVRFMEATPKGERQLTQFIVNPGSQQIDEPWINPGQTTTVRLMLERPTGGQADTMSVQLLVDGERTGLVAEVSFKPDVERAPLVLTAAKGQSLPPKPMDISKGMIFRITSKLEPDQSFDLPVSAWIRGPRQLLADAEPICRVEGDTTIALQMQRQIKPGVLPTELPVQLEVGQTLRQVLVPKGRSYVLPGQLIDATSDLYRLQFSSLPKTGEIGASVAGIPAYTWRIVEGQMVRLNAYGRDRSLPAAAGDKPTVRIMSPTDRLTVKDRKDCPKLRVQLLTDYEAYRNAKADLRVQLKIEGRGSQRTWSNLRGIQRQVTMGFKGDKVQLLGTIVPMTFDIASVLEEGSQKITAILQRVQPNGQAVELHRHSISVALDTSKPIVRWGPEPTTAIKVGSPLKLTYTITDRESSIKDGTAILVITGEGGFSLKQPIPAGVNQRLTIGTKPFQKSGQYRMTLQGTNTVDLPATSETRTITVTVPARKQEPEDK